MRWAGRLERDAVVLGICGAALSAHPVSSPDPPGSEYGDLVRRYAGGERATAVAALGRLKRAQLEAEVDALRRQALALVANHDAHFAIERRRFFYIDEFPENDRRFDFTLDDCRPQ